MRKKEKPDSEQPEPNGNVKEPAKLSPLEQVAGYFMSHPMSEDQQNRAAEVRTACQLLAEMILKNVKPCADQTAAIRKLRELQMTCSQAIALEEYGK